MCLAIPVKVKKIEGHTAIVEASGMRRSVDISFLKGLTVGEYVLLHAGFAIERIQPDEAKRTIEAAKSAGFFTGGDS